MTQLCRERKYAIGNLHTVSVTLSNCILQAAQPPETHMKLSPYTDDEYYIMSGKNDKITQDILWSGLESEYLRSNNIL